MLQESKESSSEGEEEQEEPHGREHIFKLAYGQYLAIMAKGNPRINTLTQFAVLCSRRANDLIEERGWSTLPSHDPSLDIPDISPLTKIASSPFLCLQKSQSLLEQVRESMNTSLLLASNKFLVLSLACRRVTSMILAGGSARM